MIKTRFIPQILAFACLCGCIKRQATNNVMVAEGFLVDEFTGATFNPFTSAKVSLYDAESMHTQIPLASATVDQTGHYQLKAGHALNEGGYLVLQGVISPNYVMGITNNITITNKVSSNFTVVCTSSLERTFVNQTSSPFDSIVINVTNSRGSSKTKYFMSPIRTHLVYFLRGQQNNYLNSKFYTNHTFICRLDTINPACRTVLKDSVFY